MNDQDQDQDLDLLVARAAPVTDAEIAGWITNSPQDDLLESIMSIPRAHPDRDTLVAVPTMAPSRRWRMLVPMVAAAAAVVVAVVAINVGGSDNGGRAWAAPLVEFAQRSPLLVLDDPAWHVTRADETDDLGEMTFTNGAASADLRWQPAVSGVDLNDRFSTGVDRGLLPTPSGDAAVVEIPEVQVDQSTDVTVLATVPGLDATGATLPSGTPGAVSPGGANGTPVLPIRFAATWIVDQKAVQFDSTVATLDEFTHLLAVLEAVDVDRWLSAMPASVIQAANQPALIGELLADVPLPDGFDPTTIDVAVEFSDRYQLMTRVAGAVTCAWLDQWFTGAETGDVPAQRAAAEALATSRTWTMLLESQNEGGYAEQVWQYADAINGGPGILTGAGPVPPTREIAAGGLGCNG